MIQAIAKLQLGRIERRILENHKVPFSYDDGVIGLIASRCTELDSGGRMIDTILTNTVLPRISHEMLNRMVKAESVAKIHISVENEEFAYQFD